MKTETKQKSTQALLSTNQLELEDIKIHSKKKILYISFLEFICDMETGEIQKFT